MFDPVRPSALCYLNTSVNLRPSSRRVSASEDPVRKSDFYLSEHSHALISLSLSADLIFFPPSISCRNRLLAPDRDPPPSPVNCVHPVLKPALSGCRSVSSPPSLSEHPLLMSLMAAGRNHILTTPNVQMRERLEEDSGMKRTDGGEKNRKIIGAMKMGRAERRRRRRRRHRETSGGWR